MYAQLTVTKRPEIEPVVLDDVLAHLRLDQDDPVVPGMIAAARLKIEELTRLALARTEYLWRLTEQPLHGAAGGPWCWCCPGSIERAARFELPRYPLISVDAVASIAEDGTQTTLETGTDYRTSLDFGPARLRFLQTSIGVPAELCVRFTAGFAQGEVPENVLLMVRMLVAHFYAHRGDDGADEFPKAFDFLLTDYRAAVW